MSVRNNAAVTMSSQRFRRLEVRSGSLDGGRILSMYNEQTICMTCKEEEQQRADYRKAVEPDLAGKYVFKEKNVLPL